MPPGTAYLEKWGLVEGSLPDQDLGWWLMDIDEGIIYEITEAPGPQRYAGVITVSRQRVNTPWILV